MAHSINIDATRLASPSFLIPGISGSLSTGSIQSLQLEPGSYVIQTHATSDQNWSFAVTAQGAIDYAPALDVSQGGFLTGRNTSTLRVSGFPITLDARALATVSYALLGITDWMANTAPRTLNLLPGAYRFQQPTGVVPEADFQVRLDGTIDYAAASDAFLTGRGSGTFTLLGYAITVDATALTAPQFHLSGITDWRATAQAHPLRLLPATYLFVHGSGRVPAADFTVTVAGLVDYPDTADGYLAGRGSGTFTLLGYAITVDATALDAPQFHLSGITDWRPTAQTQPLRLLPATYLFVHGSGRVPAADFTVTVAGLVDYPATADGYLAGRGSPAFTLLGYAITVDATALTAPQFHLSGITDWLASAQTRALRLLPATYLFVHGSGRVPEADFTVTVAGLVDYPGTADGYLAGRGSGTFTLLGYAITVDATALTLPQFHLSGITDWLASAQTHALRLLPATYLFVHGSGRVPAADFTVTVAGLVDYPDTADGYLAGRGSPAFTLLGYAITVDATALNAPQFHLSGITDWLASAQPHALRLLPATYLFVHGSGRVPAADFTVTVAGLVDYPDTADGYLAGRGSGTFTLLGYAITVDATALTAPQFHLSGITDWLASAQTRALRLLPATYLFVHGSGRVPETDFQVRLDGMIDYAATGDAFLTGRGTQTLGILGFPILIDAREYPNESIALMPFGLAIDTTNANPQTVSLLPSAGLSLELRTTDPKTAFFDLTGSGRIVLDDPYPFAEVRWQGRQQVIRLTTAPIRQKQPCSPTATAVGG